MAETVTIRFVDQESSAIALVQYRIYDGNQMVSASGLAGADGELALSLERGSYRGVFGKFGLLFDAAMFDVIDSGGPYTIDIVGKVIATAWLHVEDLERVGGVSTVDRLFNDNTLGIRDATLLFEIMSAAEGEAESRLLRGWAQGSLAAMASRDQNVRNHAAWVALELVTERRPEFLAGDGKGRYWAQYERAIAFFEAISKSKIHSRGETATGGGGLNANTGGVRKPLLQSGSPAHIFADESDGRTHGGF